MSFVKVCRFVLLVCASVALISPARGQVVRHLNSAWVMAYSDTQESLLSSVGISSKSIVLVRESGSSAGTYQILGGVTEFGGETDFTLNDGSRIVAEFERSREDKYELRLHHVAGSDTVWTRSVRVATRLAFADEDEVHLQHWSLAYLAQDGYLYRLTLRDHLLTTDVDTEHSVPQGIRLEQNYPNPFNPSTVIPFTLGTTGHVTVRIFDPMGRLVDTLISNVLNAGNHTVHFNAGDLPSGVYFYEVESKSQSLSRSMLLLR